jgi:hypothetical protein
MPFAVPPRIVLLLLTALDNAPLTAITGILTLRDEPPVTPNLLIMSIAIAISHCRA